jgi:hypothetical protein
MDKLTYEQTFNYNGVKLQRLYSSEIRVKNFYHLDQLIIGKLAYFIDMQHILSDIDSIFPNGIVVDKKRTFVFQF